MARTIQSPGVQINEVDLSLNAVGSPPTTIFIPGFAPKGPTSEPVQVGSLSEFEQIFGTPTNGAERYFYHTAKAVFQSPADVVVYRLPYGKNAGVDTSTNFSALVYPAVSVSLSSGDLSGIYSDPSQIPAYSTWSNDSRLSGYYNPSTFVDVVTSGTAGVSGTFTMSTTSVDLNKDGCTYYFGSPTHLKLTEDQYLSILRGDAWNWSASAQESPVFTQLSQLNTAGFIVLNKAQSSINTKFEGKYVGIIDNSNLNPATTFDDITNVLTINTTASAVYTGGQGVGKGSYLPVPSARLNFALSAGAAGPSGSISEVLENVPTFDISTDQYDDTIALGVFKLRQSVFSPDSIALDYIVEENYVGSFDYFRQINSVNGGSPISFHIDNVDQNSPNIVTLVNPFISNKNKGTSWLSPEGVPTKRVRFLSAPRVAALSDDTAATYASRMGASQSVVSRLLTRLGATNSLIALGDYSNQDLSTKLIGDVPTKLLKAVQKIENADIYPLSLTVEGGLGTIYANSFNPSTSGYFDDTVPYTSAVNTLTAQQLTSVPQFVQDYLSVANVLVEFASKTRKDHMYIADPLTNIFVEGLNVKTLENTSKNFSQNVYWPLVNQFASINSNYVAIYGNVAKVSDASANRQVWVPFSGFAAAAYAVTDSTTQPWFAPAGFQRGIVTGITDLGIYPTQKQRDQLYKLSINPVAFFPNEGFVIFGQKTAQRLPSAFDRVNVRRLFLNLEVRTRNTVKSFVFEPNSLFTRTQIKNVLTPIFELAKNTQGVYDYLIICDERNNTPSVIDDNSLVVDIYLKPVRSAEFILVNFYATRTGANFLEIVS